MENKTFNDWYSACSDVFKPICDTYKSIYLDTNDDTLKDKFFEGVQASPYLLDIETFHKGFDSDLAELGLLVLFAEDGRLQSRNTYGIIRQANQQNRAVKALKLFGHNNFLKMQNSSRVRQIS